MKRSKQQRRHLPFPSVTSFQACWYECEAFPNLAYKYPGTDEDFKYITGYRYEFLFLLLHPYWDSFTRFSRDLCSSCCILIGTASRDFKYMYNRIQVRICVPLLLHPYWESGTASQDFRPLVFHNWNIKTGLIKVLRKLYNLIRSTNLFACTYRNLPLVWFLSIYSPLSLVS